MSKNEMVKLYKMYEMESYERRSSDGEVAQITRKVVDELFDETNQSEFLVSAVHKMVKTVLNNDNIQYSTVASALKTKGSGYVIGKNVDNRSVVRRTSEKETSMEDQDE